MSDRGPLSGFCRRLGINHGTFAVCITQFGSALINSIFMFYYVRVFLNRYHISENWFQLAQVLFMIWNALNDPLFGYFQDVGGGWMRSRKKSILYGAPFFALSFLIAWFPWANADSPKWVVGLHLIVALFFYDGLFSFVLLAYCALFAEITTDHTSRVRALKYNQIFILLGTNIIVIMEKSSESLQNFGSFQFICVLISLVAFLCFYYTGSYSPDTVAQVTSYGHLADSENKNLHNTPSWFAESWQLTKQILSEKDFLRITFTNFFHVCRVTTHLNFAAIYTESLVSRDVLPLGSWSLSLFYWCCTVIPQIVIISNSRLIVKHGPYRLFLCSFVFSILSGSVTFMLGRHNHFVVLGFMLIDCINVHSLSPLFMILFPDMIDEDMVKYKRSAPISSLFFSMNALITKPAQSLAPMFIVFIMDLYGYDDVKSTLSKADISNTKYSTIRDTMFCLLCFLPVVLGTLQYLTLKNYSLKDKHVQVEKADEQLLLSTQAY